MSFPIEKILTVSAGDYIENRTSGAISYEMVGVHVELRPDKDFNLINSLAEEVPEGTEVVVDYKTAVSMSIIYPRDKSTSIFRPAERLFRVASGTALIPREKAPRPSAAEVERLIDGY